MIEVLEHKLLITSGDDFCCNVYDLTKEPDSMKPKTMQKEEERMENSSMGSEKV